MKNLKEKILNTFDADRSDWQLVSFGDLVNEVRESVSNPAAEGIEHVVGLEHINPLDIHIRRWDNLEKKSTFTRLFRKGQVLFGRRRAYQRKAAVAAFDGICSGDILVLEAKENKLNPLLLPFLVHSERFYKWAVSTSAGSLSPRTKFKHLAEFKLRIPPIDEQKKIADLLWKIDSLEDKYHTQVAALINVEKNLANKLIPKPENTGGVELGELIEIKKGITYSSTDYTDSDSGIPMINLNCFEKFGGFSQDGIKFYGGKFQEKDLISEGDIIIAATDITRNGDVVGYPVVVPDLGNKVVMSMDCCKLSPKTGLDSLFLYFLLKTGWVHRYFYTHSRGTTVLHLDLKSVPKLKIPSFTVEKQKIIARNLKEFELAISKTRITINELRVLRQSLINNIL